MYLSRIKCSYLTGTTILLVAFAISASAQVVNCVTNAGIPPLVRTEGNAEPVGDLTLICTGGSPTLGGQVVPQVNFELILNTNISSHVTQNFMGASFSEALLLVDEPNTLVNPPQRPVLNCGSEGAPDNGASGPGVCTIVSNGNSLQTYDGTGNVSGIVACDGVGTDPAADSYGCGRPNAFQGRMSSTSNVVEFLGVPFDPPGPGGARIFRFTNIRADAAIFGPGGPFPIQADIAVNGSTAITIAPPVQVVGYAQNGQIPSIGSPGVVHVAEGFASAWKARNVAFTLANATFGGSSYTYNGGTTYPAQAAQNVPGTFYYNSEDMFLYNALTAVPSPNPPAGFGIGLVANLGIPLQSAGLGLTNTGIDQDGSSSAGTRIAITFTHTPGHATVTVPSMVFLHSSGSPLTNSGVMVLTTTDAAGAGAFAAGASTDIPDGGTAVYEILYADPFSIEFADIPCTVNHAGHSTKVAVSFAPVYSGAGAGLATPTPAHPAPTAVPRFIPASGAMTLE
jgi:hypothetical protein